MKAATATRERTEQSFPPALVDYDYNDYDDEDSAQDQERTRTRERRDEEMLQREGSFNSTSTALRLRFPFSRSFLSPFLSSQRFENENDEHHVVCRLIPVTLCSSGQASQKQMHNTRGDGGMEW